MAIILPARETPSRNGVSMLCPIMRRRLDLRQGAPCATFGGGPPAAARHVAAASALGSPGADNTADYGQNAEPMGGVDCRQHGLAAAIGVVDRDGGQHEAEPAERPGDDAGAQAPQS